MSVSEELLCSFELLKPLDSSALKSHIKKGRNKRNSMLNSPVSSTILLGSLTTTPLFFKRFSAFLCLALDYVTWLRLSLVLLACVFPCKGEMTLLGTFESL